MKEQGIYEEKYYTSGTTGFDYEGYKIYYNGGYYINHNGYTFGKFSGRKTKISSIPVKSLYEAKAQIKKLEQRRKKFNFNLAGKK